VLKLIHVVAAIVAVGTNLTYFVWLPRARKNPEQAASVLPGIVTLDRRLANPAYAVLPIAGILMVFDADLGFTTFWILAAIILYVIVGLSAGILFGPSLRRQAQLATTGAEPAVYDRAAKRTNRDRDHHDGAGRRDPLPDGHEAQPLSRGAAAPRHDQWQVPVPSSTKLGCPGAEIHLNPHPPGARSSRR